MRQFPRVKRPIAAASLAVLACGISGCQYVATPSPTAPATTTTTSTTSSGGATTSSLTYAADVQPILASDCVRCHGPSRQDASVDLSTYAGVMRTLSAGNANSLLVLVTAPGGLMYNEFSGDRATKSATIKTWVVNANAAQQ
jgi:hypothetical protein